MKAHNMHCIQQSNQLILNETAIFQFSKSWIWKFRYKKISNGKRSHLVFKVSSTSSHTRSKSVSPLSNCFINYALFQIVPFHSNRRHSSSTSLMLVLQSVLAVRLRFCSRWTGFKSGLLGGHKFNGMKYGISTFNYPPLVNIYANVMSRFSENF